MEHKVEPILGTWAKVEEGGVCEDMKSSACEVS